MAKTLALAVLFLPAAALAAPTGYSGQARVTDLSTGAQSMETVYLLRDVDQANSRIVETACVQERGQPMRKSVVTMQISGDRMTVTGDHLTGTGTLSGPAWAWTALTFSMDYAGGVHIEDRNYLANATLIARKEIAVHGKPIQLWEAELVQLDTPFTC